MQPRVRSKRALYAIFLIAISTLLCVTIEFLSLVINRSQGVKLPFVIAANVIRSGPSGAGFSALDPHLGYAHGSNSQEVLSLKKRHNWHSGFAIYSKEPVDKLSKPIILIFGGSTSDPIQYGHSWPQELADLIVSKGLPATVVNGAVGAYSTNQELLKLIRDGLSFNPDLVISYSGVNDRATHGEWPHPMVHSYQRYLMERLTGENLSPLMPNAIFLLRGSLGKRQAGVDSYTLGVDTKLSRGMHYERNLELMRAVSGIGGAAFFAFIQPNAYVGGYDWESEFVQRNGKPRLYREAVKSLYGEITTIPKRRKYVFDLTDIFAGKKGVYSKDGVHTTVKGEKIIAEKIFKLIQPNLWPNAAPGTDPRRP